MFLVRWIKKAPGVIGLFKQKDWTHENAPGKLRNSLNLVVLL